MTQETRIYTQHKSNSNWIEVGIDLNQMTVFSSLIYNYNPVDSITLPEEKLDVVLLPDII